MGDPDPDLDPELDNYHQFLVIGGGISGLSAASHLAKNGFKDFRLLEARNRLGGRIATMQLGKTFLFTKIKFGSNMNWVRDHTIISLFARWH